MPIMPRLSGCEAGNAAEAEQGEGDGNLRALGEGAHLLHGAGLGDAVAGEDDGALGVADQFGGLREAVIPRRCSMG